jgi:hypothetical protein
MARVRSLPHVFDVCLFFKKMVFAGAARVTVDQKRGGDTRVITISSSSGDTSAVAAAKATCMIFPS